MCTNGEIFQVSYQLTFITFDFNCVVNIHSYNFRLEFRRLVRMYGVDLCFTPMTMTDSFCQSEKARQVEFSTSEGSYTFSNISYAISNVTKV